MRVGKFVEKYRVDHPMKLETIKQKSKETNLIKYGCENPMLNDEIKDKMVRTKQKLGIYLQNHQREEFTNYRLKVKSLTNKHKKKLYENWNGFDFYDNEYIKNVVDQKDKNYPTIDHKISIKYGFDNKISPEEIAKIENLCITKRSNNSSKGSRCK